MLKIVLSHQLVRDALNPPNNHSGLTENVREISLLADDGKPSIPLSSFFTSKKSPSVRNTSDVGKILGGNLVPDRGKWRKFFSGTHSGIESSFQQNEATLHAYSLLHVIIIELARTYEMISSIHKLAVQGGNIGILETSQEITDRIIAPADAILKTAGNLIATLTSLAENRDQDPMSKRQNNTWRNCQSLAINESSSCRNNIDDIRNSLSLVSQFLNNSDLKQMREDNNNMIRDVTILASAYVYNYNTRLSKITGTQTVTEPVAIPASVNSIADDSDIISMSPGGPIIPLNARVAATH